MPYLDAGAMREYRREWRNARRSRWFAGKSCARCGSAERLELDHVDPDRKISHRIWTWSWKRILEEVAKCQVLCRPCHQDKTTQQIRSRIPSEHGTMTLYGRGCRCAPCRAANMVRVNRQRRK